jgi:hypothetical protein
MANFTSSNSRQPDDPSVHPLEKITAAASDSACTFSFEVFSDHNLFLLKFHLIQSAIFDP